MKRYKLRFDPVTGKTRGRGGPHFGNPNGTRGKHKSPDSKRGRPAGSANMMTREMREEARKKGELPHQFALRVMRSFGKRLGANGVELRANAKGGHLVDWDDVKWAIGLAAPYYAPKLSATRLTGPNDGPIQFEGLTPEMLRKATPEQLVVLEAFFGSLAGGASEPEPSFSDATVGEEEYAKTLQ